MNSFFMKIRKIFKLESVNRPGFKDISRNGIQGNKGNAAIILDFLYSIVKTYNTQKGHASHLEIEHMNKSNT